MTPHAAESLTAVGPIFRRQRIVAVNDIDQLKHVNNVVWLRYIVQLAHAHYEALGFNFDEDLRNGAVWVVRRHEVDYHRPAAASAEILEETWVSELHGARLMRHCRFTLASDGSALVHARSLWAYVDAVTMKPKRIPPAVAAQYTIVASA